MSAPAAPYSLKRVQEMLGLSRTIVSGLIGAGFVSPQRGARNEYRFSFQDLMLLRTAHALQKGSVPPRKILRSLAKLKSQLPAELPLTGLRISAVGADVAVRDRLGQWHAESGQLLMDFEVAEVGGTVAFMQPPSAAAQMESDTPDQWFAKAVALEASDAAAAEAAYRQTLALQPDHAHAYLNLGVMLCETQRCDDAVALYDDAAARLPNDPLIHFNRAVALEDQGKPRDALASYERALALDATLADAHYNAARLLEEMGQAQQALRHFSTYRRLQRNEGA